MRATSDRSTRGLTWIGLLVVVGILGAASAAAVVAADRVTARSQQAICASDAHVIRSAVATDRAQDRALDAPTMETLVARGFLVRPSPYYSISYSGRAVVLTGVGACAGRAGT